MIPGGIGPADFSDVLPSGNGGIMYDAFCSREPRAYPENGAERLSEIRACIIADHPELFYVEGVRLSTTYNQVTELVSDASIEGSFFLADEKEYAKAAETVENTEEFDRIRQILKDKFKCNDVIISRDNSDGYIDHQSTDYYNNIDEWYDSHGIKDDEDIYNFLVGPSYIEIDNDNH